MWDVRCWLSTFAFSQVPSHKILFALLFCAVDHFLAEIILFIQSSGLRDAGCKFIKCWMLLIQFPFHIADWGMPTIGSWYFWNIYPSCLIYVKLIFTIWSSVGHSPTVHSRTNVDLHSVFVDFTKTNPHPSDLMQLTMPPHDHDVSSLP